MSIDSSKSAKKFGLKVILFLLLCGAAGVIYVTNANNEKPSAPVMQARPAPMVEYIEIQPQSVRIWTKFSGRLTAVDSAEIKPLVGGELQQVNFADGQWVDKDELLFVIDPRPYQAAVKRAEAQLISAQSRAKLAQDELKRTERLVKNKLVSDSVYDAAKNEYEVARAAIKEAESALAQARLDLNYCYIKAPFAGRVSRAELTVGNIVEKTPNSPVLTTIVASDKLYAEFEVDEQTYLRLARSADQVQNMPVQMTLASDDSVVYQGHIHSFDNQLDTTSGTIRARAVFDNTDGALIPGLYANVQLGTASKEDVLLLPNKAIATNQDKKFVYVINDDNQATYREVVLGAHYQQFRVVQSGLQAGDCVVINGLTHIRPNTVVNPKPLASEATAKQPE